MLKYMMKNFTLGNDEKSVNMHLKLALKSSLEKGLLVQSTGKGATGSVKLNKEVAAAEKVKAAGKKKPKTAAKKPKAATAKVAKTKKAMGPKRVSLSNRAAKVKKPRLIKKSSAKVAPKKAKLAPKKSTARVAPKKTKTATKKVAAAKPKATKPKAVVGKAKKPGARK